METIGRGYAWNIYRIIQQIENNKVVITKFQNGATPNIVVRMDTL